MEHNDPVRKKVIFILPLLCFGGAERALITLMNNLDRKLFDPEFVALDPDGPLKKLIKEDTPFHSLGGVRINRAFFKLKATLKKLQPDIVVTTMAHSNFLLMLLKPFFPNTKFIIREAVIPSSILSKHKKKSAFLKLIYKVLYPRADYVLSPSQDIIDEFEAVVGISTTNHALLYNQVDTQTISASLDEIGFPDTHEDTLKYICAGRLHHQKGYDRLIKALKTFSPAHPWKLIILGDGEEQDNLQNLISGLGLKDNIILYGTTSTPWKMIAAADCLLLPSRWEGMPNVVLEALSCGTPIIASADANGVAEIQKESQHDAVKIADDMQEFTRMMASFVPKNIKSARQSMLPPAFQSQNIMARFTDILLSK